MDFLKIGKIFVQDYYAIPDYQRDYEWGNSQNSTLLDDLLTISFDGDDGTHFFGAIVTIPYEEDTGFNKSVDFSDYEIDIKNVKHVVDGQQRLTTFSILISALKELIIEDSNLSIAFKNNTANRQLDRLLFGDGFNQSRSEPAPRLILNGNTGNCYNSEILGIKSYKCNKGYKGAKRILLAHDLFKKEISNKCAEFVGENIVSNSEEFYKRIVEGITNKIVFVEIECSASSDAFQVFDSLNGKGLDLTAADRIKNIFISWSDKNNGVSKWDMLVNSVGEDYLTNFFVSVFFYHKKKRIAKNKLPDEFKITYKDSAKNDFQYFYNEIYSDANLYGTIRNFKTRGKELNDYLNDFKSLGIDQVYVLIFAAAKYYGEQEMIGKDFILLMKSLQTLIVRMQVCDKSTNKLDNMFATYIDLMQNGANSLRAIAKKISDDTRMIVDDELFTNSFINFAPKENKVAEFYLRNIEDRMRKDADDRNIVPRGLTVEHIIPQTVDIDAWYSEETIPEEIKEGFKEVVENIGNKMLLYADDNSSAGNNKYIDKLNTYKNGKTGQEQGTPINTFRMVNELITVYNIKFTHCEVRDRAKLLAEYAKKIWSV